MIKRNRHVSITVLWHVWPKVSCSFMLLILIVPSSLAKIKNGFSEKIDLYRASLDYLDRELERTDLSVMERRRSSHSAKLLRDFIYHHALTESLLREFEAIAPEMYHELDSIRDRAGNLVDVYVQLTPDASSEGNLLGLTNLAQSAQCADTYLSEFGERTVSIKISVSSRSLFYLAHELGHAKYQVQNLAAYASYCEKQYLRAGEYPRYIGHAVGDLSGIMACRYERIFKELHHQYKINARRNTAMPTESW